jgi:hypothetical protein
MKPKGVPLGARLLATLLLLVHSLSAQAPPSRNQESAVRTFLAEFISAFDNLEWDTFRNCFTDDATVFYTEPMGECNLKHTFVWSLNKSAREELRGLIWTSNRATCESKSSAMRPS